MQFSVYSNLNKAVNIFCTQQEWIRNIQTMFQYYKDLYDNLAWLTQKTGKPQGNKGNFTFHTHTYENLVWLT